MVARLREEGHDLEAIAEDRDGSEEDELLKYWEARWQKGTGGGKR